MATAGQLIDDVLRRVRDPQGTAHPRTVVLDFLDRAQTLFVRQTGTQLFERTFSMSPTRAIYEIDPTTTLRIADIFSVVSGKRLWPIRWPHLFQQAGPLWWRTSAVVGPRVWAMFGTRHFIVHPAPSLALDIVIREERQPPHLTSEAVELALLDEAQPALLDFVEALLLLRGRDAALGQALAQVEATAADDTGAAA